MQFKRICLISGATAIALSAAYLGAAAGWSLAVPVFGIGGLLVLAPIRGLPGRTLLIGLAGFLACSMLGFLPGSWFGPSEWYVRLQHTIPGAPLTLSLQPYQTLFSLGLLLASMLYGAWLIQWQPNNCIVCLRALTAGISVLAAVALISDLLKLPIPFWHPSQGFGPFSNRNQTGTLMELGAIVAFGLAVSDLRKKAWPSCLWITALALCVAALLRANSRASLCLLPAAILVWFVRRFGTTVRTIAVGGGVTLSIAAAALLLGEQVVERMREFVTDGLGLRWSIYLDTVHLIGRAPFGVGLGNFAAIFPLFRDRSLSEARVIHPESDWLWLLSETGIGSLFFCSVIVASLLSARAKPANDQERDVFLAGLIAVFTFLCHTCFDVPAHRLGTVLPAFFVLALCTRQKLLFSGRSWVPWISRVTGIALIALALSLFRASAVGRPPQQEFAEGDWHGVTTKVNQALEIAPLDWSLYLIRGSARVRTGSWVEALSDFRIARVLEPKLAVVPYDEGCAWLGAKSQLVVSAWKEALNRNRGDKDLFLQMLGKSTAFPDIHQSLLRLGQEHLSLGFAALQGGYADTTILDFVESKRSDLTAEQQDILDGSESRRYAAEGDYRKAYELGERILARTAFPYLRKMTEKECQAALLRDPADYGAAYNLCVILYSQERRVELFQVLDSVTTQKNCPKYFYLIKGDVLATMGNWPGAWNAISDLLTMARNLRR